jgi:N-acetyl-1-D-myo-inositol-2-amino-2-deoxy-alpha-D-glucopyranoside deacetylase
MRLLVVVAHPDDESFGCGSVLAAASAAGDETVVLCATRGEAGESRIRTDDLAALREAELHEAARILGVGTVILLGHADSDLSGEPAPGSLVAVPMPELVHEVRALIDEVRPDVVVTIDASDGHRDHARIRDATVAAVDVMERAPSATYLWCLARSSMAKWVQYVHGHEAYLAMADELGTPDDEITTVLDVSAHLSTRWAAIHAHASQVSPYEDLPDELQYEFLAFDRLRLVRGDDVLAR